MYSHFLTTNGDDGDGFRQLNSWAKTLFNHFFNTAYIPTTHINRIFVMIWIKKDMHWQFLSQDKLKGGGSPGLMEEQIPHPVR